MNNIPSYWTEWLETFYNRVKNHKIILPKHTDKMAVIVEPRNHPLLKYVIYNFMKLLSPYGWGLHIFCSKANIELVKEIVKQLATNVYVTILDCDNLDEAQYNSLMTCTKFYTDIANTPQYILVFQTDTILFDGNLSFYIHKGYDFVGAPWIHSFKGCNGGLSLRKRESMIKICNNYTYKGGNEDGFFTYDHSDKLKIPPRDELKNFSSETIYSSNPKGLHKTYAHIDPIIVKELLDIRLKDIFNEE